MAFYVSANSKNSDISPLAFMPHEDMPNTSFEEERLKAIKKKSG